MEFETLKVTCEGRIGGIELHRPECLNAMSSTMLRELRDAAQFLDTQPDLRVVIVSGTGRAFTAGADLNDPQRIQEVPKTGDTWLARRQAGFRGSQMAEAIERMRAVTIAQLHGYCIGGGVVLSSACDMRVAAEGTIFSIPEVDLGIPLTWEGIPRLVREIGPAKTKELVMTCRRFDAEEALRIGFLNTVVEQDVLANHVAELAADLAGKPSVPVALTKVQVNAATAAMYPGVSSYLDGDLLVAASDDPAAREAAMEYAARTFGKSE